jgi:hypothetical protein
MGAGNIRHCDCRTSSGFGQEHLLCGSGSLSEIKVSRLNFMGRRDRFDLDQIRNFPVVDNFVKS